MPAQAAPVPRAVVPRWVQLVVLPIALLSVWIVVQVAGKVLLLFIVAGLIALVLNPLVALMHRSRVPRGLAVLLVYLGFFVVVAGIGVLLANPISNQVTTLKDNLPSIVDSANRSLSHVQNSLNKHGVHVQFITQGKTALQTLENKVEQGGRVARLLRRRPATKVVTTGFDIVIVFVLSIYMLIYGPRIGQIVRRMLPDGDGTPADDFRRSSSNRSPATCAGSSRSAS